MGVAFSEPHGVEGPLASVPTPRHLSSSSSSPPPPPLTCAAHHVHSHYLSHERQPDGHCADPADVADGSSTVAQQLQQALAALHLDWSTVDREGDLITVRLAAALLTSRVLVQRDSAANSSLDAGGVDKDDDEGASTGSSGPCRGHGHFDTSGTPAGRMDATAADAAGGSAEEAEVGPQELYVSAALRLATLQLGREGLQRVVVALAHLASGGESREERRLRRHTSSNTTAHSTGRRGDGNSQELHHYQRGAGFTASAAAAAAAVASNSGHMGGVGSGSALHPGTSSGRRFSTAPPSSQQQQQPATAATAAHYMAPPAGASTSPGNSIHSSHALGAGASGGVPPIPSSVSIDRLAQSSPIRGGGGGGGGVGGGFSNPTLLRQPLSARSLDEVGNPSAPPALFPRRCSVSPLNMTTAGHVSSGTGFLARGRAHSESAELPPGESSYNNVLLTSMNARSTLMSPLRTGVYGELLYSSSSLGTLMSLSTGAGLQPVRSQRGGIECSSGSARPRSPVSPFFHSTTHWVVPQAPHSNGQPGAASVGMLMSADSSNPNSVYSATSALPSAHDSRRRPMSLSRRLVQQQQQQQHLHSPYPISRLQLALGGVGNGSPSRPGSEDTGLNTLAYHLPAAVSGGGVVGAYIGIDGYGSAYDVVTSATGGAASLWAAREAALQHLRPEAVLTALCTLFAHLHLDNDDVANFVTLLVVAALEVQAEAQLRRVAEADEEAYTAPDAAVVALPSMKDIRAAVAEALAVVLTPLYTKTRAMLCAAAGVVGEDVRAALASGLVASITTTTSAVAAAAGLSEGNDGGLAAPEKLTLTRTMMSAGNTSTVGVLLPPVCLSLSAPVVLAAGHTPPRPTRPSSCTPTRPSATAVAVVATAGKREEGAAVLSDVDVARHVHALHAFFEECVPLESTPNTAVGAGGLKGGGSAAPSPTAAAAARRATPMQRGSGTRPHKCTTATAAVAAAAGGYAHSSYSESATGPTSSGSMSRSDIADAAAAAAATSAAAAAAVGNAPSYGLFVAPTQDEVRCASALLMDLETAFVLHYAEVVAEAEGGHRGLAHATAPSLPRSPESPAKQRLRQPLGSGGKVCGGGGSGSGSSSRPSTSASSSSAAAKAYPWRRRADGDPDLFVQLSPSSTVWPLRTRLLVRRHEYAYVYDALASTMALLRDDDVYKHETTTTAAAVEGGAAAAAAAVSATHGDGGGSGAAPSHGPHTHTPITLIDLNKATVEKGLNDLQVVSGPGDVEVVSLMPSRVARNSLVSQRHPSTAATLPAAATPASATSTPNSASTSSSPLDTPQRPPVTPTATTTTTTAAMMAFDDLLNCCWADAYQQDVEVYRMKGSTGTMYLLTAPAEAARATGKAASNTPAHPETAAAATVAAAAAPSSPPLSSVSSAAAGRAATAATGAPGHGVVRHAAPSAEDAVQASVIRSFERNRLVRPAVLSLTSPAGTATTRGPGVDRKEDASRITTTTTATTATSGGSSSINNNSKAPRVQSAYTDGASEVLALELGSEPTRIAAYPLRLIYRGVLHHFFFPNPSARDHWYQQMLQISWVTQSRRFAETVAAAPQNVERYLRNRISFPTGPGAFECLDMLGAGTFGRVLLVQHKLSKRLFAMKVIRKSGFHGIRNVIEARREKKILDMLDCPYIMKIHSSFQTDSRVYMLFDYLPGAELLLHTQSAQSNHFDETTSRFYIAELAIAVEYLRVRGIVHRDIKGDNLVLDAEGHVVLTDFGFAKNILSPSTDPASPLPRVVSQHTSCGTLAYIAPEVLSNTRRRHGYGLAVDWWSLGVVLFTFLTGYFPFLKQTGPETSQAIVSSPLQFPPRPALSDDARSLLEQLLQKDPERRITCLADLRHHRFFDGFDWAACRERRLPPPLVLHKDSYRSPRTTADARQLLQDRVRRSLAWASGGAAGPPYVPPSHSRRPASDKLAIKHQPQFEEEEAELRLVERAYGSDCMPKPLSSANDVFGPLFRQQELCGSDREESESEGHGVEDYIPDLALPTMEALRRLREGDVSLDFCNSLSDMSVVSAYQDGALMAVGAGDERGSSGCVSRAGRTLAMPTPPVLINVTEDLYSDLALSKFTAVPN